MFKTTMKQLGLILTGLFITFSSHAQNDFFKSISLSVDTSEYTTTRHTVNIRNTEYLYFNYDNNDEVALVQLTPDHDAGITALNLLPSEDFKIIDSLIFFNRETYQFKVRFSNITKSNFLSFRFIVNTKDKKEASDYELKLFPITKTKVNFYPGTDELFIGEEKIFDLVTDNPDNIKLQPEWTTGLDIDYFISESNGHLKIHVLPHSIGKKTLTIRLHTYKPSSLSSRNQNMYELPAINHMFFIKASRLAFLQTDKKDVMIDDKARTHGIEIQIDNNRFLEMKKTYRIEDQESAGGPLVGELFTKSELANDKVLCILRTYNYHQQKDGYLYIKDGDNAKFITNLNILPQTTIYQMMIMRDGRDWTSDNTIYPGERFTLRIEGVSLSKANFKIEELVEVKSDSAFHSDNFVEFKFRVPLNISKKNLAIYSNNISTGRYLNVKEYQRSRPFDYIFVDYGSMSRTISRLRGPEIYPHAIKNIILSYNADLIDAKDKLYGKQYVDIEVRVTGNRSELIELKEIENVCFIPGDESPRYNYYDKKDGVKEEIRLNDYLVNKTTDLPEWYKIQITLKNRKDKMGGEGFTKVIEIIRQPYFRYDMDVSFPGLLTNIKNTDGDGPPKYFGGISMAMIAQFSFYDQNKVNQFKPYRIGAGFLALNAFNFNSNVSRDVAVVILGSLSPTRNTKLSAPLYLGFGYLLNGVKYGGTPDPNNAGKLINQSTQHWIWLIGPGIRVSF